MKPMRILISGASIAGPALAYWLDRYGFEVIVVERAPRLRPGGFAVDFRGAPHLTVLERMGVLERIRAQRTDLSGMRFIDAAGLTTLRLPPSFLSGDVEIERGELAMLLHDETRARVDYRFGDSIRTLAQDEGGVDVTFEGGAEERFDLVIGADGLHSNVRRLVFGDERSFLRYGGYYVAGGFRVPNHLGLHNESVTHCLPGRSLGLTSHCSPEVVMPLFVWHSPAPIPVDRWDLDATREVVRGVFGDMGWEAPRVLEAMGDADAMYFDSLSQVRMDRFSTGRVALIGDAAYGATMGGLGTGLAVVAAYVLAGELARAEGDHAVAFARYQEALRPYARGCQKVADGAGPFLAPRTRRGIWIRDVAHRLLTLGPMVRVLEKMTVAAAAAITLTDYPEALLPPAAE